MIKHALGTSPKGLDKITSIFVNFRVTTCMVITFQISKMFGQSLTSKVLLLFLLCNSFLVANSKPKHTSYLSQAPQAVPV